MNRTTNVETSILLVDDEDIIRKSFCHELRMENFTVTAVAGGSEAVAALAQKTFHLVITDLVMPGIDGFGVLKAVKELAPQTGVIILTGYGDMRSAIDALRLGADDFTLKPCDIEELVYRIHRCIEKHTLLQQLSLRNLQLEEEIERREQMELQLRQARTDLEERVRQRTVELSESNTALSVLLKKREEDQKIMAAQIVANSTELIEPYLIRLKESRLSNRQRLLVDILSANVNEITSPFCRDFSTRLARLTPTEIQIANLIKLGKRTKEIAAIMHLSPGTISIHRKNIRKKLQLTHRKINLQTALSLDN